MQWEISAGLTPYPDAVARMEERVAAIREGRADELIWLVEHPPLYTAGTSAKPADLLDSARFPVYETGRGGEYTYHGPGQRVVYLMLDLEARAAARGQKPDLRAYVKQLEQWIITTLAAFGIQGEVREGRVGVWVARRNSEQKIAALGIRVRKWVSYHGIAINVAPELAHYQGIVPCGIRTFGVTSLADLGTHVDMQQVDDALQEQFHILFDAQDTAL